MKEKINNKRLKGNTVKKLLTTSILLSVIVTILAQEQKIDDYQIKLQTDDNLLKRLIRNQLCSGHRPPIHTDGARGARGRLLTFDI